MARFDDLRDIGEQPLSRRRLLQTLGAAAIALPTLGFAQGSEVRRRPTGRATTPYAPPPKLPFAPTGWKTVWLDHLSYRCTDYEKAAAFYAALMGWTPRSDDGVGAVLDLGDAAGSIRIRGGLAAPPPAALTDAGLGAGKPPTRAMFDGFAWGIAPWNTARVKAALEERGLRPVADHAGADYQAFHIKDPDGFDVWITNGTRALRRKTPAAAKLRAPAPFAPTNWRTRYLDHLSFEVSDYRRTVAFYQALLGWQPREAPRDDEWPDSPQATTVRIGDIGGAIIRARAPNAGANGSSLAQVAGVPTATIGHISFGISPWETETVRAALIARDVAYTIDGKRVPRDDMAGALASFHVPDAMGWDLQISNKVAP